MTEKTNYKCEDCGSKELLIPSWKTQNGMQDFPDPHELVRLCVFRGDNMSNGDAWCIDCEKIIWVETQ